MSTEATWEKFYQDHDGIYSSGHFSDRKDLDGQIYNEYQIVYRQELLSSSGKARALELGCGNKPIFEVINHFSEIFYTDISQEALHQAESMYKQEIINDQVTSTVVFTTMNVDSFEFKDASLDLVFNTRAPHRDKTSQELMRTLRDGGVYVYQTIGEEDFMDMKLLLKGGRFYDDYLKQEKTRFGVIRDSLEKAGFDASKIELIFDKRYKFYFEDKDALKEKLWLLVGDIDFDLPENDSILDQYIQNHRNGEGKIWVENHRIIVKATK